MKLIRPYKVNIPNHCSEKWDGMKQCGENKGCFTCQKTVYDFTKKTDIQIHQFIKSRKKEKICGRFTSSQLNRSLNTPSSIFSKSIKFLLPTVFILGINKANAFHLDTKKTDIYTTESLVVTDSVKISGQVIDSVTKEPAFYANIVVKGTKTGTSTDENGKFELTISSELLSTNDTLVINCMGYEEQISKIDPSGDSNTIIKMKSAPILGDVIFRKEPLIRRIFKRKNKAANDC